MLNQSLFISVTVQRWSDDRVLAAVLLMSSNSFGSSNTISDTAKLDACVCWFLRAGFELHSVKVFLNKKPTN